MKTTILLVRHGQTDWNLSHRWQGHLDIPLNDTGRRQANLLAQRLAALPIRAIYTSDLVRALETAQILAEPLNLKPVPSPAFRERNGGKFQSLTTSELEDQFPDIWRQVRLENATPPDGESLLEVTRRMVTAYETITQHHEGEMVALVGHGGALNLLIAYVIGLPLGQPARISLRGNTGVTIVEIRDGIGRVVTLNDTHHLEASLESGLARSLASPAEMSA